MGTGGMGMGGMGMGGMGMGGMGMGGASMCLSCSDIVQSMMPPTMFDQLCGWDAQSQSCMPNTSCAIYEALFVCACTTNCVGSCANNACMGQTPNNACINCIGAQCSAQFNACNNDV
jgi:hypothetical protein